jgi:hypothetical protein
MELRRNKLNNQEVTMATTITTKPTAGHPVQGQSPSAPTNAADQPVREKVSTVYQGRMLLVTVKNFGQPNGLEQLDNAVRFDMTNKQERKGAILECLKQSTDSTEGSKLALKICLNEKLVKYSQAGRIASLLRNIPFIGQMLNTVFNRVITVKAEKALKKAEMIANNFKASAANHNLLLAPDKLRDVYETPDMEIENPEPLLTGVPDLSELNENAKENANNLEQKAAHFQERLENRIGMRHHHAETNKSRNEEIQKKANENYEKMQLEQEEQKVNDEKRRRIEEKNKADKALRKERTQKPSYSVDSNAPPLPPRKIKTGSVSQPLETPKNEYEQERALALQEAQELFAMFDETSTTTNATDTKSSTPFHPVIPRFAPKLSFTPKQSLNSSDNTATVTPPKKKKARKKVAVIENAPQVLKDGKVQRGMLLAPWVPENVTTYVSDY